MKKETLQDLVARTDHLQNGIWNIEESSSQNFAQIIKINAEIREAKSIVNICNSKLDKLLMELEAIRRNGGKYE